MRSFNPNHPAVRQMEDHWPKLCLVLMKKFGLSECEITEADVQAVMVPGGLNIVLDTRGGGLILRAVNDAEALRIARAEGGLPV